MTSAVFASTPSGGARIAAPLLSLSGLMRARNSAPSETGATFDLILGRWGEGAQPADRSSVSLEFRRTPQGPAFRVVDSAGRPAATSELVGRSLSRVEVIGTPLAKLAFEVVDAVWVQDPRIDELVR